MDNFIWSGRSEALISCCWWGCDSYGIWLMAMWIWFECCQHSWDWMCFCCFLALSLAFYRPKLFLFFFAIYLYSRYIHVRWPFCSYHLVSKIYFSPKKQLYPPFVAFHLTISISWLGFVIWGRLGFISVLVEEFVGLAWVWGQKFGIFSHGGFSRGSREFFLLIKFMAAWICWTK